MSIATIFRAGCLWCGLGLAGTASAPLPPLLASPPDEPEPAASPTRARGTLRAARVVDLASRCGVAAELQFLVPEGKLVEEGTILAKLDDSALGAACEAERIALERARAGLAMAEAELHGIREESGAELRVAEARLAMAKTELEAFGAEGDDLHLERRLLRLEIGAAETRLAILKPTGKRYYRSDEPRLGQEQRDLEVAAAKARLEAAGLRLAHIGKHALPRRRRELELATAGAELELIRTRVRVETATRQAEARIAAAQAERALRRQRVESADRRLEASRIVAPWSGRVVYPPARPDASGSTRRPVLGATVRDGETILRLVDPSLHALDVRVPLPVAQRVTTGQEVAIRVDARPGRRFVGRIARLRVEDDDPATARVTVELVDEEQRLRPGMTAEAELRPRAE